MQLLDVKTYKLERIVIDEEFSALVQPLDPKELAQLEENIRRDGIREPLSIWMADGTTPTLLDGHNRRVIAETLGMAEVPVHYVKLPDRDAALLWIEENQAGRRNLTDDQRAMIWASILQRRSKASRAAQLEQARQTKAGPASVEAKIAPTEKNVYSVEVKSTTPPGALTVYAPTSAIAAADPSKLSPLSPRDKLLVTEGIKIGKKRARAEVAKESGLPESKLRAAAKLKKEDPAAAEEVRTGKKTLRQIRKEAHAARTQATKEKRLGKSEAWRVRQIHSLVSRLYGDLPYEQRNQEIFRMLQHTRDSWLSPDYQLPEGARTHIEGYSAPPGGWSAKVRKDDTEPEPPADAPEVPTVLDEAATEQKMVDARFTDSAGKVRHRFTIMGNRKRPNTTFAIRDNMRDLIFPDGFPTWEDAARYRWITEVVRHEACVAFVERIYQENAEHDAAPVESVAAPEPTAPEPEPLIEVLP